MNYLPKKGSLEWHLMKAQEHAASALDLVYDDLPRHNRLWRWRLLRAESLLMRLMLHEMEKKDNDLPKPEGPSPMVEQN